MLLSSGIVGGDSIGRFMVRIGRKADVGLDWDGVDQIPERKKVLSSRFVSDVSDVLAVIDGSSNPLLIDGMENPLLIDC
jgi:hypothetical protein